MSPIEVLSSGMVCGVGFSAPAACAAIRAGIAGFEDTRFMFDGEWLIGSAVPFKEGWRGRERLLRMVVPAISECLSAAHVKARQVVLILCVTEPSRPGRFDGVDSSLIQEIERRIEERFLPNSAVLAAGRVGGVDAIVLARKLIAGGEAYCMVAGVDTFLVGPTLASYVERRRVQTADNSNGFIPGEAAAAVLLGGEQHTCKQLCCIGVGFGAESATIESELPLRGEGLVQAFRSALDDARCGMESVDYRIADVNGEQYGFKEAALAAARTVRPVKQEFDIWHPADCIGEVGAAIVPAILAVALAAFRKAYAPGLGVLCHFGNDDGRRGAVILQAKADE